MFICFIVHLFMKLLCDLVVLCLSSVKTAILFGLESINESDKGFIIELNKDDACLSFCIEL